MISGMINKTLHARKNGVACSMMKNGAVLLKVGYVLVMV